MSELARDVRVDDVGQRIASARAADCVFQQQRKHYLQRTVPKIGGFYIPLASAMGGFTLVIASRASDAIAPALLRCFGVSTAAAQGFPEIVFMVGVTGALWALGMLANLAVSLCLERWHRVLKQELETHSADEEAAPGCNEGA